MNQRIHDRGPSILPKIEKEDKVKKDDPAILDRQKISNFYRIYSLKSATFTNRFLPI